MKLIVQNVWTWIEGGYPKNILDPILSYQVDGYFFAPSYRKGFWDGRYSFLKKLPRQQMWYFPSGFVDQVVQELDKADCPYLLEDTRDYEAVDPVYVLPDGTSLYDFQRNAVNTFLTYQRGILKLATGGGKTETSACIVKAVGGNTIWAVGRLRLLHQTHERLQRRLGCKIGRIGEGICEIEPITVAMIQSLQQAIKSDNTEVLEFVKSCKLIVGDECHHLKSCSWNDVFSICDASWRLGLTATPSLSGPGMSLIGMVGKVLVDIPAVDLIAAGRLVPPRIWFCKFGEKSKLPKKTHYQTIYKDLIVNNVKRNELIKDVAKVFKEEKKSCLILVKRINHGEILADMLCYFGIKSDYLQGSVSEPDRKVMMEKLFDGRLDCVVATTELVSEGIDLPELRALINATGTRGGGNKSEDEDSGAQTLQILGRLLRKSEGKKYCDYVDIADRTHKSLIEASLDRVQTLEQEGYSVFVKHWHEYKVFDDTII